MDVKILEKWKNAVIHLECVTEGENFFDKNKKLCELNDKLKKKKFLRKIMIKKEYPYRKNHLMTDLGELHYFYLIIVEDIY